MQLSFTRCGGGGRQAVITVVAWVLQLISVVLSLASLVETFPWYYYRELNTYDLSAERSLRPSEDDVEEEVSDRSHGLQLASARDTLELRYRGLPAGCLGSLPEGALDAWATSAQNGHSVLGGGRGAPQPASSGFVSELASGHAPPIPHGPRASPITTGGVGGANGHCGTPHHPWSLALLTTRHEHDARAVALAPASERPARGGSHSRTGSGGVRFAVPVGMVSAGGQPLNISKVSSVASSMQSLDSTAVD
mmetsp:Transcript_46157/g.120958  ORF Transcript_46157/g.120958 Transcript_46157/m.120958 type:complete len:251 (-) Transcript_46157:320-1072(-)